MSDPAIDYAVVVLGMHRSGTSALTGVLRLCGLTVPATLIPSSEANERGFWESEVINTLNDEILSGMDRNWRSLEPLPAAALDPKERDRIEARVGDVIAREFPHGGVPVIKDPRICRLLPYWEPALSRHATRTVFPFIIRHPVEIARSLGQRNDLDFDHALLLWARYFLDAEASTRGKPRAFITYGALIEDWRVAIGHLRQVLDLPFDLSEVDGAAIDDYLSADLRHQSVGDDTQVEEMEKFPILATAFDVLSRWAGGGAESADDYARLDSARADLDRVSPLLSGVVERVRVERKRRSVALTRADEALANLARANRALDSLGDVSSKLSELAQLSSLKDAVSELSVSQEQRFSEFGRRVKKLVTEASVRAEAASSEQARLLVAAQEAVERIASETGSSSGTIAEILAAVNDRSALDALVQRHSAVEARLDAVLTGFDERARLDAALVDALEQATSLRRHIGDLERQVEESRALVRLHLGTLQVRDDEAKAQGERMTAVSDELKSVKRKYRSTQANLAKERDRLKDIVATLAVVETTLARYRRSFPWRAYMALSALLGRLRTASGRLLGDPAGKRQERALAMLQQSWLFDRDWYLQTYPDVALSGIEPARHYLDNGWREGRDPGPGFSTTSYLKAHADVAAHGINPLLHYIEYGHSEGRGAPEHKAPALAKPDLRAEFGPAAECARFEIEAPSAIAWQRAGGFAAGLANPYRLDDGLAVGSFADEAQREAFLEAIAHLGMLSGAPLSSAVEHRDAFGQAGELIDAWHAGRNRLRSRWRRPDGGGPMVVRVLQQVGGQPRMVGEALVAADLDLVDAKMLNPFFPLLFVFADAHGGVLGWRHLPFPSLCRGGLHHPELVASGAEADGQGLDVSAVGNRLAAQLLAIRSGAASALVSRIEVNLADADGTHPLFQASFKHWLATVMQVAVGPQDPVAGGHDDPARYLLETIETLAPAAPRQAGATLILGSAMVPSIAALAATAERAASSAADVAVPLILSGEEIAQPSLLARPSTAPPPDHQPGFAPKFPILALPDAVQPADPITVFALQPIDIRPLSDSEQLVPVSPGALPISPERDAITWLVETDGSSETDLLQSLEALAAQGDAGPASILFVGSPSDRANGLARRLFEGRVQAVPERSAATALIDTPLAGFLGSSVVMHDRRTVNVLAALLARPATLSASVALVSIERRGKGYVVSPTDAGPMTTADTPPLTPQQVAASTQLVWRSSWWTVAPPRDLWLTRAECLATLIDRAGAAPLSGQHACSNFVTASYCSPRRDRPAEGASPIEATQDALRIELVA